MSDALTESGRDSRRAKLTITYYRKLIKYFEGKLTKNELLVFAKNVDAVRGGSTCMTNFATDNYMERIEKMRCGNEDAWLSFLINIMTDMAFYPLFEDFKELSPFKGKLIVPGKTWNWDHIRLSGEDLKELLSKVPGFLYEGQRDEKHFCIILDKENPDFSKGRGVYL